MIFFGATCTKSGSDHVVGGDQGLDAQEEKEKVKCCRRHEFFREQLETVDKHESHSKEGLFRLTII